MRTEAAIWEHSPDAFSGKAGKDLDRLHRLADSTQRAFSAALKQLMAIQAERAPKPAAPPSSGLFAVPKRSKEQC
jgi:sarcosine oxidase gamma subunit